MKDDDDVRAYAACILACREFACHRHLRRMRPGTTGPIDKSRMVRVSVVRMRAVSVASERPSDKVLEGWRCAATLRKIADKVSIVRRAKGNPVRIPEPSTEPLPSVRGP